MSSFLKLHRERSLCVTGLSIAAETPVLDAEFSPGFHLVSGVSGSGKSTLLKGLAGIRPVLGGVIRLDLDLCDLSDSRQALSFYNKHVSMQFHEPFLVNEFTVRRNLRLPEVLQQRMGGLIVSFDETVASLNLMGILDNPASKLSQGEAQRVSLARALINSHRVLILDEPLVHLQHSLKQKALRFIRDKFSASNQIVLISTHDPDVIQGFPFLSRVHCSDAGYTRTESCL